MAQPSQRSRIVKIYVGNLPYETTDQDLKAKFEAFGQVDSASVVMDRDTGRSKGFGFVEMTDKSEAQAAIAALDGKDHNGRALKVYEARPKTESRGGGGRGYSGGGGGYQNRNRW
ncbi:RNA-binding protein [bacterium]|nr:RNA-binding protein [bacterium]